MNALPTSRDEAWRYSDLKSLASVWPITTERQTIAARESATRIWIAADQPGVVLVQDLAITLEAGASLTMFVLNADKQYGRIAIDVTLGDGAHFELSGAMLGGGDQTLEIVTTVNHVAPNATSAQTIRSVLGGRATASYLGKVAVARHAQKTDARQSVKAMLLDRSATANARPELEIFADDVKCAHGATVGELDANALFYLASRGLPPAEAKALMLQAFIAGVFDAIEDETTRERIEAAARDALGALL